MKAWSVVAFGKPLELIERPTPVPTGSEVLVEVEQCGICHSDLHFWHGQYELGGGRAIRLADRGVTLPAAPGHEVVGRVVAKGPEAEGVEIGDSRLVYSWIGCGRCERCRAGEDNYCAAQASVGVVRSGGFGSHVLVPHPRYLLDYGPVDPAYAATLACSGLTAYAAIRKAAPRAGEPVLVMGAGGLGLAALATLRALDRADNVIVVDIDPGKLRTASAQGARHVVDASQGDVVRRIQEAAGAPLRIALDFVGVDGTARPAYDALTKGGTLVLVGVGGGELTLSVTGAVFGARTVIGSNTGSLPELQEVVALAAGGKLQPIPLERLPIGRINEGITRLEHGQVTGRAVLDWAAF
jgi:alcohol dehydrogenase/propanol-preferring alcohol dehydrogenase